MVHTHTHRRILSLSLSKKKERTDSASGGGRLAGDAAQPVLDGREGVLDALRGRRYAGCVLCADESMRGRLEDLDAQAQSYQAVNIKLDKTGGLTHAIAIAKKARALGMKIMMGCMVSTSLSMAPAAILAAGYDAEWVDLDGPLLLAEDRDTPLHYEGSIMFPPEPALWG